jgi:hypothetical protein
MILHPDYKYMSAVAEMDPHKSQFPEKQRNDCLRAVQIIQGLRDDIEKDTKKDISKVVTFVGYRLVPTWNGFISESEATIHLYPTVPYRGDLLTLKISAKDENGSSTRWYNKYLNEYNEIMRFVESDFANSDLWKYGIQ